MEAGERILLQNIVSQVDARVLLAKVAQNQPAVMKILCNTSPTAHSPTDSLFLENILVAPTRSRPVCILQSACF